MPPPANYAKTPVMTKALLAALTLATTGVAVAPLFAAPQTSPLGAVSRDFMLSSIATLTLEGDIAATLSVRPKTKLSGISSLA